MAGRLALVLLAGLITILAFPHEKALSFLTWGCMVPWLITLPHAGWKERGIYGFLYGCLYILPGQCTSIWHAIRIIKWSWIASSIAVSSFFICYIIPYVIFSCLYPYFKTTRSSGPLRLSMLFTCLISWFPLYFPVTPACLIHDQPLFFQIADIGGETAVIFLILLVNISLAEMWNQRRNVFLLKFNMIILGVILAATVSYGMVRMREYDTQKANNHGHWITIMALQTTIYGPEDMRSLIRDNPNQRISALEWTRYGIRQFPDIQLVVWPESPVDTSMKNRSEILIRKLSEFSRQSGIPVLFSYLEKSEPASETKEYNTLQLMGGDGEPGANYRKQILTPFYEYNPLKRWIHIGDYTIMAGDRDVLFPFGDIHIIPALCYEIHSSRYLRKNIQEGGNLVVHSANFYAFGKGPIGWIDLAMTKVHAVEHRVPIVRSTNYGYGAFIQADGTLAPGSLNPPSKPNALAFPLFVPEMDAPFNQIGNSFLYMLSLYVMVDTILIMIQSRKRKVLSEIDI